MILIGMKKLWKGMLQTDVNVNKRRAWRCSALAFGKWDPPLTPLCHCQYGKIKPSKCAYSHCITIHDLLNDNRSLQGSQ